MDGSCACAYRAKNPDTVHACETLGKWVRKHHGTIIFTHTFPRRAFFLWSIHLDPRAATPLTVLRFAYYYGSWPQVHGALVRSCLGGAGAVALSALVLLVPRRRPLHGEARFATRREIAGAGLFDEHGIILGRLGRRCLMLAGQQGVVLAAPPRAGKGVGVVIPNLLNWPDSVICVDIKRD